MKKKNIGSTFDSWLREDGICKEVSANAIKRVTSRKDARAGNHPQAQANQESFTRSCGNVFADLGLPHSDLYLGAAQKARTKKEFQRLCRDIPGNEEHLWKLAGKTRKR